MIFLLLFSFMMNLFKENSGNLHVQVMPSLALCSELWGEMIPCSSKDSFQRTSRVRPCESHIADFRLLSPTPLTEWSQGTFMQMKSDSTSICLPQPAAEPHLPRPQAKTQQLVTGWRLALWILCKIKFMQMQKGKRQKRWGAQCLLCELREL